jgi:endonuclease YncB( thermonuclease family)
MRRFLPLATLASALLLAGCGQPAPGRDASVPAGTRFTCTPIFVWDGDGPILCREGHKVRVAGISAREIDGRCRPGHPCAAAPAIAARDHLVGLLGGPRGVGREGHVAVRGPALACVSAGSAGGRTAAWCEAPGAGDLSCAMLASGLVARWDRHWRGRGCPHPGR